MFIPQLNVNAFSLTPKEYVEAQRAHAAQQTLSLLDSPWAKWSVVNGVPHIHSVDRDLLLQQLIANRHSKDEAERFVALVTSSTFNEMNRRGYDKLETRITFCNEIAKRLLAGHDLAHIPIGVAALPYLNAGAHPVPEGGSAILMNVGLSLLNDFFIKYENMLIAESDLDAIRSELAHLAKAIFGSRKHFGAIVSATPQSLQADDDIRLTTGFRMAMATLFVMLHEYGHIFCGHTDEMRSWPRLEIQTPEVRNKYYAKMRSWEHEADKFALDALLGSSADPEFGLPPKHLVHHSVLDVFMVMSLASGTNVSEAPTGTHPHPKTRLLRLYGLNSDHELLGLKKQWSEDGSQESDDFMNSSIIPLLRKTGFNVKDESGDGEESAG